MVSLEYQLQKADWLHENYLGAVPQGFRRTANIAAQNSSIESIGNPEVQGNALMFSLTKLVCSKAYQFLSFIAQGNDIDGCSTISNSQLNTCSRKGIKVRKTGNTRSRTLFQKKSLYIHSEGECGKTKAPKSSLRKNIRKKTNKLDNKHKTKLNIPQEEKKQAIKELQKMVNGKISNSRENSKDKAGIDEFSYIQD